MTEPLPCQFEEWSREQHRLVSCGEPGTLVRIKNRNYRLCAVHKVFAEDAINDYEIKLAKLQAKQERDAKKRSKLMEDL